MQGKKKTPAIQPQIAATPMSSATPKPGQTVDVGGVFKIRFSTVEEAKRDIQKLRVNRKQLVIEQRAVNAELAKMRSDYQIYLGMRGKGERPKPKDLQQRGGCLFFGFGAKTTYTHEEDRRQHAMDLAPLEAKKAQIKQHLLLVDRAIAQVELFIADQAK